jgi:hypothetical protein
MNELYNVKKNQIFQLHFKNQNEDDLFVVQLTPKCIFT